MTERKIIALAGLSGAGKTTLIRDLQSKARFLHLSASDLIKEQKLLEEDAKASSEELRTGDISDNQRLFRAAFKRNAATTKAAIIFDCHTIIDTPNKVELVPESTFDRLHITHFCFLQVGSSELVDRRAGDTSRTRPTRSQGQLDEQETEATEHTFRIAKHLDVPFVILTQNNAHSSLLSLLGVEGVEPT